MELSRLSARPARGDEIIAQTVKAKQKLAIAVR
jgi:hypothetical protein